MTLNPVEAGEPFVQQPHYFVEIFNLDLRCVSEAGARGVADFFWDADGCLRSASSYLRARKLSFSQVPPAEWDGFFLHFVGRFIRDQLHRAEGRQKNPILLLSPGARRAAHERVEGLRSSLAHVDEQPSGLAPAIHLEYVHGYLRDKSHFYFKWRGEEICFATRDEADFYHSLISEYTYYCEMTASMLSAVEPQDECVARLRNRLYELAASSSVSS